jgi:hypothetical protein
VDAHRGTCEEEGDEDGLHGEELTGTAMLRHPRIRSP